MSSSTRTRKKTGRENVGKYTTEKMKEAIWRRVWTSERQNSNKEASWRKI